jgi:hypothetical protein
MQSGCRSLRENCPIARELRFCQKKSAAAAHYTGIVGVADVPVHYADIADDVVPSHYAGVEDVVDEQSMSLPLLTKVNTERGQRGRRAHE